MNELSWLLYAADVAGSVKGMAGVTIGLSAASTVALSIIDLTKYRATSHRADVKAWDERMAEHIRYPSLYPQPESDRPADQDAKTWNPWIAAKAPLVALGASALLFCAFPASGTIYAIAASEMGERVVNSETGDKAVKALNAWLDKQISGGTK